MSMRKGKLLAAYDGSQQSFEAVRYLSRMLPPDEVEVTLFHVFASMPEHFWDLEAQPEYRSRVQGIGTWAALQEKIIRESLERARSLLLDAGWPESAVRVRFQNRRDGVARDIIAESERGCYDGVVVGRWGVGRIKDLVFGSIATKLVGRLVRTPLWVVGGSPSVDRALIAVDGSEGSLRAVDFAGVDLARTKCRFTLLHVVRGTAGDILETFDEDLEPESDVAALLDRAMSRLGQTGVAPHRIDAGCVRGVASRARAIVDEARAGGYGTVFVGRRGLSRVEEFFIGRVSNKVVQLATDVAVVVVA